MHGEVGLRLRGLRAGIFVSEAEQNSVDAGYHYI